MAVAYVKDVMEVIGWWN